MSTKDSEVTSHSRSPIKVLPFVYEFDDGQINIDTILLSGRREGGGTLCSDLHTNVMRVTNETTAGVYCVCALALFFNEECELLFGFFYTRHTMSTTHGCARERE